MAKTKKYNTRRKKFRRFVLWFLAVSAVLLAALVVTVRLTLPADRLGVLISGRATEALGRQVVVGRVAVNPFGSIEVDSVRAGFTLQEGAHSGHWFSVDRVILRYRILPLFMRRLEISSVAIQRPRLHWIQPPADSTRGRPMISPVPKDTLEPAQEAALPLAIGLSRFQLDEFDLEISLPDSMPFFGRNVTFGVDNIHLDVSGIHLPRQFMERLDQVRGQVSLSVPGELRAQGSEYGARVASDLHLTAAVAAGLDWSARLDWRMTPEPLKKSLRLTTRVNGRGLAESVSLEEAALYFDDRRLIALSGEVEMDSSGIRFDTRALSDSVNLSDLSDFWQGVAPPALVKALEAFTYDGTLILSRLNTRGRPDDLNVDLLLYLKNGSFQSDTLNARADGLNVTLRSTGQWRDSTLVQGEMVCQMRLDSAAYGVNDSLTVQSRDVSFQLMTEMEEGPVPVRGRLLGGMEILGAQFSVNADWDSLNTGARTGRIHGSVRLDSLNLNALPETGLNLAGQTALALNISATCRDSIQAHFSVETDSVFYQLNRSQEALPPLYFQSEWHLSADEALKRFTLISGRLSLNELFRSRFVGLFDSEESRFSADIQDAVISNERIMAYLPQSVSRPLEGVALFGHEHVTGRVEGQLQPDTLMFQAEAALETRHVGLFMPRQNLELRGFNGYMAVNGDGVEWGGKVALALDTVSMPALREMPWLGTWLEADFAAHLPESAEIDGRVEQPDMNVRADFQGAVKDLDGTPRPSTDVRLSFESADSVAILDGMSLWGDLQARVHVTGLDSVRFAIDGEIRTDSLFFSMRELFTMDRLTGAFPFALQFDTRRSEVLPQAQGLRHDMLDYASRRQLYRATIPEIGSLSIRSMTVAGYHLDGLDLDLYFQGRRFLVPWLNLNVLGGSLGASLWAEWAGKDVANMRYGFTSQISRINSAVLLGEQADPGEDTELNGSIALTGTGIDPAAGIDLNGFFHITKIGPRFAGTLLQGLDPNGTDRSIRLTRRLINVGWKIGLFSFESRHGYVYPSLVLEQPWFSPLRLPDKIEYGRFPMDFFLQQFKMN